MKALGLAVAVFASGALGAGPEPVPDFRLHLGAQVGVPFVVGATAVGTFGRDGRPRFDLDATWEPSAQAQSYSLGAAWRALRGAFFLGGRLRVLQYAPPWARGGNEPWAALGLETGGRFRLGPGGRGVLHLALHGTFVPGQAANLNTLVGVTLGFSWAVFER